MSSKELMLNIAVNLGRLGRWAQEGRVNRLNQFISETQEYINRLEQTPKSSKLQQTLDNFIKDFKVLKDNMSLDQTWSETMFTWANILTHRASL